MPAETHIRAEYASPDTTDGKHVAYTIYGPRDAEGNQGAPLVEDQCKEKGVLSFDSKVDGEHWICLRIDQKEFAVPEELMKFQLKVSIGTDSFDYVELAKREHLDDLELKVMKLRDRVRGIQKQQDYMKRKDFQFRNTSESNNSRVMWVSLLQIGIWIFSAVIQVRHLRHYFHKKKLV